MSDTKTASWIAALERARTELEGPLSADERWRALRAGRARPGRPTHQQALAANPVYRCWEQLNRAIEELQRRPQAEPGPVRRRVSLRDTLKRIRSDGVLVQDSEPQARVSEVGRTKPDETGLFGPEPSASGAAGSGGPTMGLGPALPDPEEATVSFVIREPARLAPGAGDGGSSSAPKKPVPPELRTGEAEVVIVPKRRR